MKKKIATVWLGGCSGCHMSFLDIDERILEVAKLADIVKSPIVDTKEMPEVDIALIEGAVANEEHVAEIKSIRRKAKILVSFGDCAVTGNVSSLRNFMSKESVLRRSYVEAESNENGKVPEDAEVSKLIDRVGPLHEFVKVDYYIPGCPPSADLIFHVLNELLHDRTPVIEHGKLKFG
jgi:NAD-reducing hydrogenase small subunit